MKTNHLIGGLATLAIILGTTAFADDIYKWTDEDGNVQYGDRPTGKASEEQLKMSYNRTSPEALQGRVEAERDAEVSRNKARAQAADDKRAAEEGRLEAEKRQADCDTYRAKYNKMLASPRVYRKDAEGNRIFLDEAQRAESLSRAERYVAETCSS